MYSKRVIHKAYVDGNAYITVGEKYNDPERNPFRAPVKGEHLKRLNIPVSTVKIEAHRSVHTISYAFLCLYYIFH